MRALAEITVNASLRNWVHIRSPRLEVIVMPSMFWLALLLGYLVGIGAAVLTLPAPVIEPLYGHLAIASGAIVAIVLALLWWSRSRASFPEPHEFTPLTEAPSPRAAAPETVAPPAAAAGANPAAAEGVDDVVGDPARLRLITVATAHGLSARELREILFEGRVEAMVQPLASLAGQAGLEHAVARLRAADGRLVEPREFRSTAARCGLLGLIDQALVMRTAQALRQGPGDGERRFLCAVGMAAFKDPAFVAEIEMMLAAGDGIGARIVLEVDSLRAEPEVERTLAALIEKGAQLGLRRIASRAVDVAEIVERRFELVHLAGPLYALDPEHPAPGPLLRRLSVEAEDAGLQLVVDRRGAARQRLDVAGATALGGRGSFERARADAA
jgi:EAL domain-containing protein (putative c-di-GMP-specific phosphodiesterase class I)